MSFVTRVNYGFIQIPASCQCFIRGFSLKFGAGPGGNQIGTLDGTYLSQACCKGCSRACLGLLSHTMRTVIDQKLRYSLGIRHKPNCYVGKGR